MRKRKCSKCGWKEGPESHEVMALEWVYNGKKWKQRPVCGLCSIVDATNKLLGDVLEQLEERVSDSKPNNT